MKNIYEVLAQKETLLTQVQREVEALRIAARLLEEDGAFGAARIEHQAVSVKPSVPHESSIKQFP